jgi:hypothetical protein
VTAPDIAGIKARLTIPEVWRLLSLPGEPGRCVPSPFRPDRHPSLSLYDDGQRWKDHATGDGGDVLDFIAAALRCDAAGALRWAREALGGGAVAASIRPASIGRVDGRTDAKPKKLPPLRLARAGELEALAALRGFRVPVLAAAQAAGLLRMVPEDRGWGAVCWAVTCPARRVAEARRLDGRPFPERRWTDRNGERTLPERKCHAWAVTPQAKAWPVNLAAVAAARAVAWTEGAPDLIAALHFIESEGAGDVAAVAMLGAANARLAAECLPAFAGKRVRIFAHDDPAGYAAAQGWARQLRGAGAAVDAFSMATLERHDGRRGKDLCDLLAIGPDSFETFPQRIMP